MATRCVSNTKPARMQEDKAVRKTFPCVGKTDSKEPGELNTKGGGKKVTMNQAVSSCKTRVTQSLETPTVSAS